MLPPSRRKRLSFRLTSLFLGLCMLSAAIVAVIVFFDTQDNLLEQIEERIRDTSLVLQDEYASKGLAGLAEIIRRQDSVVGSLEYRLEDAGGRLIVGDLPKPPQRTGWMTLALPVGPAPAGETDTRVYVLAVPLAGGELLVVGEGLRRIDQARAAVLKAFGIATIVVLVITVGGGVILNGLFIRRIDRMAETARRVMAGDLTQRIPASGTSDELEWLATTLNHMLDRTAALVDLNREIGSNIAHDLRSPLAHMLQRLDRARLGAKGVEDYETAIDGAVADVNQVLATFNAILRIAEVEARTRRLGFRLLDLGELVRNIAETFGPVASDDGQEIEVAGPESLVVDGDRELLTQLLVNLVENAMRHTPAGTRITLSVEPGPGSVALVVADDGPGIPAADRAHVLERFARLDRSRSTPGSGLGLTLVGAIAELHEGTLRLEDNKPGLRCVISLPRPKERAMGAAGA